MIGLIGLAIFIILHEISFLVMTNDIKDIKNLLISIEKEKKNF